MVDGLWLMVDRQRDFSTRSTINHQPSFPPPMQTALDERGLLRKTQAAAENYQPRMRVTLRCGVDRA